MESYIGVNYVLLADDKYVFISSTDFLSLVLSISEINGF